MKDNDYDPGKYVWHTLLGTITALALIRVFTVYATF